MIALRKGQRSNFKQSLFFRVKVIGYKLLFYLFVYFSLSFLKHSEMHLIFYSMQLNIYLSLYLSIYHAFVCLFAFISSFTNLSVCVFIHLLIYVFSFIYLFMHLFRLFMCLFVYNFVNLLVYQQIHLSYQWDHTCFYVYVRAFLYFFIRWIYQSKCMFDYLMNSNKFDHYHLLTFIICNYLWLFVTYLYLSLVIIHCLFI